MPFKFQGNLLWLNQKKGRPQQGEKKSANQLPQALD